MRPREQRGSLNDGWPLEPVTHNVTLLLHPPFTPTVTPTVTSTVAYRYTRRYRVTCRYTHRYADGQRSEGLHCALVSSRAA